VAACSLAALVSVAGCSSSGVSEAELRACPRGDAVWERAAEQAETAGDFDALRRLAEEVASANPDRWEPRWIVGESLVRPGLEQRSLDLLKQAVEPLEQALQIAEREEDPLGVARAGNRLGSLARRVSRDYDASERYFRTALDAARRAGRADLAAKINNNLAGVLLLAGRMAEALDALERAAAGFQKTGLESNARRTAYHRAVILKNLGNLAEARELLDEVYGDATEAGDDVLASNVCAARGHLHRILDERDDAREWYARVTDANPRAEAAAALGRGRVALRDGEYDEASMWLDRAIDQEVQGTVALLAKTFRAEVDLRSGQPGRARERLVGAVGEADELGLKEASHLARLLLGKAVVLESESDPAALQHFREAVAIVESQGEGLDPGSEGLGYLRERAEPFTELAAALARADEADPQEILGVVERAHSRSLRRVLQGGDGETMTVDLARLRRDLAPGELLLDYLVGHDRGVLIAVARGETRVSVIPGWTELRRPIQRYRSALRRPLISASARLDPLADLERDLELGRELRDTLLGPVADLVDASTRLLVVPDQDLALLPFAALPGPPGPLTFLGDDKEIAVLPMAGAAPGWPEGRGPILLAGDPLPDPAGEFGALPLAGEELSQLDALWSPVVSTQIRGEDLVARRFGELPLASFGTLHFATHAVASSLDPRRCAVILSGGEKLGMQRIAELELGPALVVLSACQTGEGEIIPGEGVVGLSWAFLRAGAMGIAASLWSVEDASTARLMVAFHRHWKAGRDPVSALALAQRELSDSVRHPAYWAPFVLILSPQT
jgi:CHAT domain-containing protein/tetratricopeptide (TPR) repeat protein